MWNFPCHNSPPPLGTALGYKTIFALVRGGFTMAERPTTCTVCHMTSLAWCHLVIDTRVMDCQHQADLPYAFSMQNKLSKLIGAHVYFLAEFLRVWQTCLGAATMPLLRDYLTACHLPSRELPGPCFSIQGRDRFYWFMCIPYQLLSVLIIITCENNRKENIVSHKRL